MIQIALMLKVSRCSQRHSRVFSYANPIVVWLDIGPKRYSLNMQNTPHVESWYAASANLQLDFPALQGETSADVCIIGGGYTYGKDRALRDNKRDEFSIKSPD